MVHVINSIFGLSLQFISSIFFLGLKRNVTVKKETWIVGISLRGTKLRYLWRCQIDTKWQRCREGRNWENNFCSYRRSMLSVLFFEMGAGALNLLLVSENRLLRKWMVGLDYLKDKCLLLLELLLEFPWRGLRTECPIQGVFSFR